MALVIIKETYLHRENDSLGRNSQMPIDTKRMIADAFLQMTHQKNLDKITIKDIVECCSISRQAFYYHFQDILDVIEWIVQREMKCAVEECLKIEDPRSALLYMVRNTIEHDDKIKRLLASQHGEQIQQFLIRTFFDILRETKIRRRVRSNLPTVEADMTLRFLAFGTVGVIKEAISNGNRDAESLCNEIYPIIINILEG